MVDPIELNEEVAKKYEHLLPEKYREFASAIMDSFPSGDDAALVYYGAILGWFYPEKLATMINIGSMEVVESLNKWGLDSSYNSVEAVALDLEDSYGPRERTSEEVEAYTHVAFNKV